MGRPFIVLGDQTDHGGVVIEASVMTDTHGKGIARVGDQVTCPKRGHGPTVIVTGDPTMIIDGKPAARHGDKCACGATLIAGQAVSTVSDGGSSNPQAAAASQAASAVAAGYVTAEARNPVKFDEQTELVVSNGTATLVGLPWFIKTADGRTFSGRLDENGQLPRVITESEQDYETLWGEEALEHMTEAS